MNLGQAIRECARFSAYLTQNKIEHTRDVACVYALGHKFCWGPSPVPAVYTRAILYNGLDNVTIDCPLSLFYDVVHTHILDKKAGKREEVSD